MTLGDAVMHHARRSSPAPWDICSARAREEADQRERDVHQIEVEVRRAEDQEVPALASGEVELPEALAVEAGVAGEDHREERLHGAIEGGLAEEHDVRRQGNEGPEEAHSEPWRPGPKVSPRPLADDEERPDHESRDTDADPRGHRAPRRHPGEGHQRDPEARGQRREAGGREPRREAAAEATERDQEAERGEDHQCADRGPAEERRPERWRRSHEPHARAREGERRRDADDDATDEASHTGTETITSPTNLGHGSHDASMDPPRVRGQRLRPPLRWSK